MFDINIRSVTMKNYYTILGIKFDSTPEEIKTAYLKLSKKFHPDLNNQDKYFEEMFKEIQEAYGILSNIDSRVIYDLKHQRAFQSLTPKMNQQTYQKPENSII